MAAMETYWTSLSSTKRICGISLLRIRPTGGVGGAFCTASHQLGLYHKPPLICTTQESKRGGSARTNSTKFHRRRDFSYLVSCIRDKVRLQAETHGACATRCALHVEPNGLKLELSSTKAEMVITANGCPQKTAPGWHFKRQRVFLTKMVLRIERAKRYIFWCQCDGIKLTHSKPLSKVVGVQMNSQYCSPELCLNSGRRLSFVSIIAIDDSSIS